LSSLCFGIPLGLAIGGVNALLIQRPVAACIGVFLAPGLSPFIVVLVSGIIAGALQGAFLRSYTRPVIIWLAGQWDWLDTGLRFDALLLCNNGCVLTSPDCWRAIAWLRHGFAGWNPPMADPAGAVAHSRLVACEYSSLLGHFLGWHETLLLCNHGSSVMNADRWARAGRGLPELPPQAAAQHGAVADRLDRGHFGIQKQERGFPNYQRRTFQPAANAQTVGPHSCHLLD